VKKKPDYSLRPRHASNRAQPPALQSVEHIVSRLIHIVHESQAGARPGGSQYCIFIATVKILVRISPKNA
jgi:hypothetical protein